MVDIDERKSVIALLREYRTLPALWDVKHEDYSNNLVKQQKYEILLEKYRETNPNAGIEELKRKINTLRTNYRREQRRLKKFVMQGRHETSTLYYFKELLFLNCNKSTLPNTKLLQDFSYSKSNDVNTITSPTENLSKNQVEESFKQILPDIAVVVDEMEVKPDVDSLLQAVNTYDESHSKIKTATEQMAIKQDINNQPVRSSSKAFLRMENDNLPLEQSIQMQDIYKQLCSLWYQKLTMIDNNQRIFAEKLINDVIFNSELGLLNFNTSITNLSPYRGLPKRPKV